MNNAPTKNKGGRPPTGNKKMRVSVSLDKTLIAEIEEFRSQGFRAFSSLVEELVAIGLKHISKP